MLGGNCEPNEKLKGGEKVRTTTKTEINKNRFRKRAEDRMDTVYNYIREVEEIPSKYPLLPENLIVEHKALVRKAWDSFDSERSLERQ